MLSSQQGGKRFLPSFPCTNFPCLFSEVDSFEQNNTEIRILAFRFVFFKMALRGGLQEEHALFVICDRYSISTKMLVNTVLLTSWLLGITDKSKPTSSQSHKCIKKFKADRLQMIVVAKKYICLKRVFGIKQVGEGQITVKDLPS